MPLEKVIVYDILLKNYKIIHNIFVNFANVFDNMFIIIFLQVYE